MAQLSVVVPTLNERPNVQPIVERLSACLSGIDWEVIFVDDDSPDGTASECRRLASSNSRVHIVQRVGRKGLASACLEGMLASSAPYLAVMDGDMQHDETVLPKMYAAAQIPGTDVVVGSRHLAGGGMGAFSQERVQLSNLGRRLSRMITSQDLSDPMSGFFVITRSYLNRVAYRVSGVGFKILLDLIASSQAPVTVREIPYVFRTRLYGESKLDITVGVEYFVLLADKLIGYTIPLQFALYSIVGATGVLLYLATLMTLYHIGHSTFLGAQVVATGVAMVSNFFLNNIITYRTNRLRGWKSMTKGLILFCLACSAGVLSNVSVAKLLVDRGIPWIVAGITGIVIGSVWNYSATAVLTWQVGQRRARRSTPREA
jgi:dolichol-phosphate mannosyltransferase